MKTQILQKSVAALVGAGLALSALPGLAQGAPMPSAEQPAAVNLPAPLLGYAASQVLQLAQAKVNGDTIIAYIKNSGNSYPLNAAQIMYLRQQGISDAVITAMLSQPRADVAVVPPTTPAPQPMDSSGYPEQVAPATPDVQAVPDADYYAQPSYPDQPYYYYPAYGWYPSVTYYYGWGGGGGRVWHGGGYYGGGYHGGGHFGGGYVGGGHIGGGHVGSGGGGHVGGGHVGGHR